MKQLWSILIEKVKQVEANYAALGIGIMGLFALSMVTRVIIGFLTQTIIKKLINIEVIYSENLCISEKIREIIKK